MRPFSAAFPALLLLTFCTGLTAHPIPDIPVRGSFDADGACTIRVEVDPRCFEADWEMETYLLHIQLTKLMSPAEQVALKAKARSFVEEGVEFTFEPQGRIHPEFSWEFTTLGGGPLVKVDDPVMVTGTWRTRIPEGMDGYRIRATEAIKFAVNFENVLHGKRVERVAVLFPGEESFLLDMEGKNAAASMAPPDLTEEPTEASGSAALKWVMPVLLLGAAVTALMLARLGRT